MLTRLFENEGPYTALKKWMDTNAKSFGFFLAYPNDSFRKGFQYEPWHYTYKPKSKSFLKNYLKIDLKNILLNKNILGKELFTKQFIQKYIEDYVLGVSSEILD